MGKTNADNPAPSGRALGGAGAPGRGPADARPAPRAVTTGRKTAKPAAVVEGYFDTGERVEMTSSGRHGVMLTRHLDPVPDAPADAALVDALAFSVLPPDERSYEWVLQQMAQFLPIEDVEHRRGLFGFRHSARIGEGVAVVAWGGDSQRGRVFFSLMGQGCSLVKDWHAMQQWLERHRAVLKRADVAYDDHEGKLVSIEWAVQEYKDGGFNAGGRNPRHECFGDWLEGEASTKGRTLGIGSRASGKYARCYEKGKQLGDASSRWTRIEVEWRAEDRHIPYEILTKPGQYLAGAYPCLAVLSERQSTIRTVSKAAQIAYDRAVENAKLHCGKTVNLMLAVLGGDYAEVVGQLIRPGIPGRIEPFSYHVRQDPLTRAGEEIGYPIFSGLQKAFTEFEVTMKAELAVANLYAATAKGAYDTSTLAEFGLQAFPQGLETAVPEAADDAKQAARCIAFDLPTAAAFHLHRVHEAVLHAYFKAFAPEAKPPSRQALGTWLQALEREKAPAELVAAVRDIANLHRNPTLHPEHTLKDSEEAISLLGSIHTSIRYMLRTILQAMPDEPAA